MRAGALLGSRDCHPYTDSRGGVTTHTGFPGVITPHTNSRGCHPRLQTIGLLKEPYCGLLMMFAKNNKSREKECFLSRLLNYVDTM